MPLHTMQTLTQRQRCETGPSASGCIHRQNEMWSRFHGADKQPGTSDGRRAAECIQYQIFIDAFHDSFARYANLQGHADGVRGMRLSLAEDNYAALLEAVPSAERRKLRATNDVAKGPTRGGRRVMIV